MEKSKLLCLCSKYLNHFGYIILTMTGKSMLPSLGPGQKIVIRKCAISNIQKGDIVAYKFFSNEHITIHRVIDVIGIDSYTVLQTKGDANSYKDKYIVDSSTFLGKAEVFKQVL